MDVVVMWTEVVSGQCQSSRLLLRLGYFYAPTAEITPYHLKKKKRL